MSFWHFNAADPVADAVQPGFSRWSQFGVGYSQRALPTFFKLTTGPIPDGAGSPWDTAAFGEFLLPRLYTHSAGLFDPPGFENRAASFNIFETDFPEWASFETNGNTIQPDRWHIVCRELWIVAGESIVPYRRLGWWAFWGQWNRVALSLPFVYGSHLAPDDDPWNPCFGGRMLASYPDTALNRMPEFVDVVPWFP